jgi:hypothetical protein
MDLAIAFRNSAVNAELFPQVAYRENRFSANLIKKTRFIRFSCFNNFGFAFEAIDLTYLAAGWARAFYTIVTFSFM